jgi:hypothetical protein
MYTTRRGFAETSERRALIDVAVETGSVRRRYSQFHQSLRVVYACVGGFGCGRTPRHGYLGIGRQSDGSNRGMAEITKKSEEQKGAEAEVESFRKNLGPFVVAD